MPHYLEPTRLRGSHQVRLKSLTRVVAARVEEEGALSKKSNEWQYVTSENLER